jgi:hypothetical protein
VLPMSTYDFSDDCWTAPRGYAAAEVGDVFDGLPLTRVDESFEVLSIDGEQVVPAIFTLALVVGLYEGHAVVAPITTRADVSDRDAYDVLVESGRSAQKWARLPVCAGLWAEDALASLFLPSTLPLALLERLQPARAAAMTESARALLYSRFARAWTS